MTPSIVESQILAALGDFLTQVLPVGTEIMRGQVNKVPEPVGASFVLMTPLLRGRLSTNVDATGDVTAMGSISGTVMTISQVLKGAVALGAPVFGVGVLPLTYVTAFGTGSGGVGTYTVSSAQNIAARLLAFGANSILMPTRITIQLDFHDQDGAADNAATVQALFRDDYACEFFATYPFSLQPLETSEPVQAPFINGEDQYEDRWTLDVVFQANPEVSTPQQFADTLDIGLIEIDARFPPGG